MADDVAITLQHIHLSLLFAIVAWVHCNSFVIDLADTEDGRAFSAILWLALGLDVRSQTFWPLLRFGLPLYERPRVAFISLGVFLQLRQVLLNFLFLCNLQTHLILLFVVHTPLLFLNKSLDVHTWPFSISELVYTHLLIQLWLNNSLVYSMFGFGSLWLITEDLEILQQFWIIAAPHFILHLLCQWFHLIDEVFRLLRRCIILFGEPKAFVIEIRGREGYDLLILLQAFAFILTTQTPLNRGTTVSGVTSIFFPDFFIESVQLRLSLVLLHLDEVRHHLLVQSLVLVFLQILFDQILNFRLFLTARKVFVSRISRMPSFKSSLSHRSISTDSPSFSLGVGEF